MKKFLTYCIFAALLVSGCTKAPSTKANEAEKRYFDAWISVNHPSAEQTELGAYILQDQQGDGAVVGDADNSPYLRVSYTVRDLDNKVSHTTSKKLSQQIGSFDHTSYYGPVIWDRNNNSLTVAIEESVAQMKVGGTRTIAIPGWLNTTNRYKDAAEYLEKSSGINVIYEITIEEAIKDMTVWENDSLKSYIDNNYTAISSADTLKAGFYYIQKKAPSDTREFPNDTTVYINYIGRLLNGQVFDTNIRDTAKFYGIYNSGKDYGPSAITWKEKYNEITMSSISRPDQATTIIDGFAYGLYQMRSYEQARFIFYSPLGYSSKSSGNTIPAYSPLIFDVELVDKEK